MVKVAFVVQRYGLEVNGGAELLCRWNAELMRDTWDIEVVTTCSLDYMTWANYYSEGEEKVNEVVVHRFPVIETRKVQQFNRLCEKVFWNSHTREDEVKWMKAQGPNSPKLIEYIHKNRDNFDIFIFFTYLYGTTFWGLPLVADKAFLVPTAHDEPPIYLSIFQELFSTPKGFIFSTPEEKSFLIDAFHIDSTYSDIIGVGIQFDQSFLSNKSLECRLPENYVIYAGRIDESKGCKELFEFWEAYKKENVSDLKLLLVGRSHMEIPRRDDIIPMGFISEEDKFTAISHAKFLIMPSHFESLSIAIMEAWLCNRPVLVNGRCAVLKGQCRRSNGGLWYDNYQEFSACLQMILNNKDLSRRLAENGKRYTVENYNLSRIKRKYMALVSQFLARKYTG